MRHSLPIPQLLGLNNITITLNPRYRAIVSSSWTEFLLVVKDVRPRDSGTYECQVSGPNHASLSRIISLTVIGLMSSSSPLASAILLLKLFHPLPPLIPLGLQFLQPPLHPSPAQSL